MKENSKFESPVFRLLCDLGLSLSLAVLVCVFLYAFYAQFGV